MVFYFIVFDVFQLLHVFHIYDKDRHGDDCYVGPSGEIVANGSFERGRGGD